MKPKIYIWGTGEYADEVYEALDYDKCVFCGFIDSSIEKQRKLWKDRFRIVSPQSAIDFGVDYAIISAYSSNPIVKQAINLGYKESSLIRFWDDGLDYSFISELYRLRRENARLKLRLNNAPYEYGFIRSPIVKGQIELLDLLYNKRVSLARFGDGEFEMIRGNSRPWFQKPSNGLAIRLKEVLLANDDKVVLAIADDFSNLDKYTEKAADGIRQYLDNDTRAAIYEVLDFDRIYYDAYVTRPYLIYKNKMCAKEIFEMFKKIWKDRDVLIVEGKNTRMGINNDLFGAVNSVRRIICPERDAYESYEGIVSAIRNNIGRDDLVLVSLGPTATIIAYDLGREGVQVIDIGQLDTEYEWFLMGAEDREEIPGKSVSELSWWHNPDMIFDDEYRKQIVVEIA